MPSFVLLSISSSVAHAGPLSIDAAMPPPIEKSTSLLFINISLNSHKYSSTEGPAQQAADTARRYFSRLSKKRKVLMIILLFSTGCDC